MTAIRANISKSYRIVIIGIVLAIMFVSFLCASVAVKAQGNPASANDKIYYTNIMVDNGDTLWDIASEYVNYDHYNSVYEYMNYLKELNNLTSDALYAGTHLMVVYYVPDGGQ